LCFNLSLPFIQGVVCLLNQKVSQWVESLYHEQIFHNFATTKFNKLKKNMYASITNSNNTDDDMAMALKRELDDAMVKLKRTFRESLDKSIRAVSTRQKFGRT